MRKRTKSASQVIAAFFTLCSLSFAGPMRFVGGRELYQAHCAKCHGTDGSKGKAGKNKLDASILSPESIVLQIENGKKGMPAFKKKLSGDEITAVSVFILTLRK